MHSLENVKFNGAYYLACVYYHKCRYLEYFILSVGSGLLIIQWPNLQSIFQYIKYFTHNLPNCLFVCVCVCVGGGGGEIQ